MTTMATSRQDILSADFLNSIGEPFLAGHVGCASKSPILKYANGVLELFRNTPLQIDATRSFSPCGRLQSGAYCPIFNGQVHVNQGALKNTLTQTHGPEDVATIVNVLAEYWEPYGRHVMWQGHATLDYPTILREGLPFYRREIEAGLRSAGKAGELQKPELFLALSTVMQGIEDLVGRYVAECERLAREADTARRSGLERIGRAFERMTVGAPRDFYEAMQTVHFFNAVDGLDNAGRLDQYLYPYYRCDLEEGRLDRQTAEEWLVDLLDIWGSVTFWNIAVGGSRPDGTDASNDLTYMILRARRRVNRPNPNLSLRLPSGASDELLRAACETLLKGQAQPAVYNDDLYVRTLEKIGVPRTDAAEFVFGGCSETHIAGKGAIRDEPMDVVGPLLRTLGVGPSSEGRSDAGLETITKDDFEDFDTLLEAYKKHVREAIDEHVALRNTTQQYMAEHQPALVRSIFVSGCLEKGMSHTEGGAVYNHGMIDVYGIPNVANSLYVIKKLVYDNRRVSLGVLRDALARSFEGCEGLRELCRKQAKYGNDADDVDRLASEVSNDIFSYIQTHRIWNGGIFYGFCASAPGYHVTLGQNTGATPDGRLAGTPLANSMGPVQGTDTNGPTAALNSVSKLDLSKAIGTPVVNLSFHRTMFIEQRDAIIALIRTFFRKGGMQLQLNVVDPETLADALEHPGEHADLIVRVSGYSAYFTRLSRAIQEEIAARTVH